MQRIALAIEFISISSPLVRDVAEGSRDNMPCCMVFGISILHPGSRSAMSIANFLLSRPIPRE